MGTRAYNIRVHRQTFHSDGIRSNPPPTSGLHSVRWDYDEFSIFYLDLKVLLFIFKSKCKIQVHCQPFIPCFYFAIEGQSISADLTFSDGTIETHNLTIISLISQVSGTGGEGGTHVYREKRAWQEHYRSNPRQPESASLEHMLGSLRADMSRQGVQTPQKGCCNACEKPIVGQVDIQP